MKEFDCSLRLQIDKASVGMVCEISHRLSIG